MPHVVIEQAGPLEVVFAKLDPFVVADGNLILRVSDVFLNQRGQRLAGNRAVHATLRHV